MKYSVDKNHIDLCKDCVWYNAINKTCNAKKCSGYGIGLVTFYDRKHCTQQVKKQTGVAEDVV